MTVTSASAIRKCAKVSQTRYESRLVGENGLKTGVSEGKRKQKTLSFRTVSGGQENPIQTGFPSGGTQIPGYKTKTLSCFKSVYVLNLPH